MRIIKVSKRNTGKLSEIGLLAVATKGIVMAKRITKQMEICYKLRHHDFIGLTPEETAEIMGVSIRQVNRLMADMKRIASQLFPILTPAQSSLWSQWFDEGLTCYQIAENMGTTERTIQARLLVIKKMMNYNEKVNSRSRKMLSFDAGIDESKIISKF